MTLGRGAAGPNARVSATAMSSTVRGVPGGDVVGAGLVITGEGDEIGPGDVSHVDEVAELTAVFVHLR